MAEQNYPEAWLRKMQEQLKSEFPAFLDALHTPPIISLRMNPRKPAQLPLGAEPVPWAEGGYYLPVRPRFVRDPLFHAGAYYVQEASSMLIAQLADWSRDMRILDMCAAPGGKSTLLASRMSGKSVLVSNEIVGARARVLEENIIRWGDPRCMVTCANPLEFAALGGTFDLILVDAPCSGEGMFRKDPETISHWSPAVVKECVMRQHDILMCAVSALRVGGRLIYSTCTYNEAENEEMLQWVLEEYRGALKIVSIPLPPEWGLTPGIKNEYDASVENAFHCYPHKVRGEGLFLCALEKTNETGIHYSDGYREHRTKKDKEFRRKQNDRNEDRRRDEKPRRQAAPAGLKQVIPLAEEFVTTPLDYIWQMSEDNLRLLPQQVAEILPALGANIRVLRAGVTIGQTTHNKFIPDHDLAMSGLVNGVVPKVELNLENALRYLRRMEPEGDTQGRTGWALATFQGFDLGWVKMLGNRISNHFPRNWRIRVDVLEELGEED